MPNNLPRITCLPFESLKGKTLVKITRNSEELGDFLEEYGDNLLFEASDGEVFALYHEQDCCEDVYLEDVCGDFEDLLGLPLEDAELRTNRGEGGVSETWSFYHLRTHKGSVTLRWYGTSNGYYSERVRFARVDSTFS